MNATGTPPPITCPVSGRTWPGVKRMDLRTCTACGGLIDVRHEEWESGPGLTRHVACPNGQATP